MLVASLSPRGLVYSPRPMLAPPGGCHLGPRPQVGKTRVHKSSTRWMRNMLHVGCITVPQRGPIARDRSRHPSSECHLGPSPQVGKPRAVIIKSIIEAR